MNPGVGSFQLPQVGTFGFPLTTPNDFASLAEVEDRLLCFQDHYERAAAPFQWTFTRQDLAALLAKLAAKDRLAAA